MLPPKVHSFVYQLAKRTEAGEFKWKYDSDNSQVSLKAEGFSAVVEYRFNTDFDMGEFRFFYQEGAGEEYTFSSSQYDDDYFDLKRLFDAAQASQAKFPF